MLENVDNFGYKEIWKLLVYEVTADLWSNTIAKEIVDQGGDKVGEHFPFLSPPVHMHGGLICIAFCLSVCDWTKSHQTKNQLSYRSTEGHEFSLDHWRGPGDPNVDLEGQGLRSKSIKVTRSKKHFRSHLTILDNLWGQRSHGSRSKVIWFKVTRSEIWFQIMYKVMRQVQRSRRWSSP